MVTSTFYDRLLSIITIIAVIIVVISSDVGFSLWFADFEFLSNVVALGYITGLGYVFYKPMDVNAHKLVGALSVVFWSSRGLAFIEFIYRTIGTDNERWDLSGAVAERILLAIVIAVMWHMRSLERIAFNEVLGNLVRNESDG